MEIYFGFVWLLRNSYKIHVKYFWNFSKQEPTIHITWENTRGNTTTYYLFLDTDL